MGRIEYLTRLALGRSAFQELEIESHPRTVKQEVESQEAADGRRDPAQTVYIQQYNSKGRPINPPADASRAEQRRAQNEVLALAGVLERTDKARTEADARAKGLIIASDREQEDRLGERLDMVADMATSIATHYPNILLKRCLAGMYQPDMPFAAILARDFHSVRTGDLGNAVRVLCPDLDLIVVHFALGLRLAPYLQRAAYALEKRLLTSGLPPETLKIYFRMAETSYWALAVGTEIALLPLVHYWECTQLGLTPRMPLRPLAHCLLQYSGRFFAHVWQRELRTRSVWLYSSLSVLLADSIEIGTGEPATARIAAWSKYEVLKDLSPSGRQTQRRPGVVSDPCGRILYEVETMRNVFMQWLGWNGKDSSVHPNPNAFAETHSGGSGTADSNARSSHRTSSLARLPARRLGLLMETLLGRILLLPLESLLLRCSARAFVQVAGLCRVGPMTGSPYVPSSGVWVGGVMSVGPAAAASWVRSGRWASSFSKVGLALGLLVGVEAALYGGVYMATRSHGIDRFGWGSWLAETDGEGEK